MFHFTDNSVPLVTISPKRTTESFLTASSKRSCQHIENETAADEGNVFFLGGGGVNENGMFNFIFSHPLLVSLRCENLKCFNSFIRCPATIVSVPFFRAYKMVNY